ncbi:aldehyde dehydrogenase family protein [Granulicella mallensis]|uniref:Aldehyde dehydrogenase n=1 Tax=Granulicella mallensis TaxID=940614 RepID=A0A7W7ZNM3_9BACT|nr:aldehyde dehydrogenase family protein [Granulicella mallensis]MBB5063285.1 acyl-CoA reductase-like NAD-dependent aldehyde dehydrogenase [Granulicella mallensis]
MSEGNSFATRIENARRAQAQWAKLSVAQRCRALCPLRNAIASQIDRIVSVLSEEVGKPPLDALTGDIMVTLEQLRFYEREAPRILRTRSIGKPWFLFSGTRFRESPQPHGVVLIFSPWNYPFQLSVIPMATALFAGNAVLLKCSEQTPRTASLIEALCREANLPEGLVQVSCEPAQAAEPAEAASGLIDAGPDFLFFTGSSRNGRAVAQHAARHRIPAVFELGGKDACLVFSSCDLARAIRGALYGAFSNAGQACVGVKRIYVEQSIYAAFLRGFLEGIGSLRMGTTFDSDLGLVRFDSVRRLLSEQVDDALARGATLHTAWQRDSGQVPPLVLTGVPPESLLLTEESFGPVVCLEPFRDEAEALALANSTAFALSASIFTGDSTQGQRLALQLDSGTCAINDVIRNIGNPSASFGGNRASGYGRYHGPAGLLTFSRTKSVMTVTRPQATEIHWFPFTLRTFQRLRSLLLFRHASGSIGKRIRHLFPQR